VKEERKVVWITGGSSGIGKAIAYNFAKINCKVYISGRRNSELERTVKEFAKEKLKIKAIPCNVASETNVSQVIKNIINEEGRIDCLVNNAGTTVFKNVIDTSNREAREIIDTNLLGAIYCSKNVLSHMIERRSGLIINISSFAARKIYPKSAVYSASKAGLVAFADCLREEVREFGIKVVNILPGPTETPMWDKEIRKNSADKMMKPDDLAHLVVSVFLQPSNLVSEEIVVRPITGDLSV
jgi:short-subunit dehydrogenase